MRESRQAVLETLDTHIYVDITSSSSNDTKKIMFSTNVGDYLFINNLNLCAASLMAAGFQSGPKDYFPNKITTLAIHERNFYLCTVPGLDKHAEFAKVADILCKFTALKTLYIVVGTANKKLNLTLASDLEPAWSHDARERIMIWSVNRMDVDDFRDLVSGYVKKNKQWEVPNIDFLCPAIPLPRVTRLRVKDHRKSHGAFLLWLAYDAKAWYAFRASLYWRRQQRSGSVLRPMMETGCVGGNVQLIARTDGQQEHINTLVTSWSHYSSNCLQNAMCSLSIAIPFHFLPSPFPGLVKFLHIPEYRYCLILGSPNTML